MSKNKDKKSEKSVTLNNVCPLLLAGVFSLGYDETWGWDNEPVYCLRDGCAWWNDTFGECAILAMTRR